MIEIHTTSLVYQITRERRQSVIDAMIYGNVKSMEHYRELMGNLEALNHVDQELKNLLEKQEQRNE